MAKKATQKNKSTKTAKTQAKTKTTSSTKAKLKKAESQLKSKANASEPAAPKKGGKVKKTATDLKPVITVTHDEVAAKAYEIWLAKGRPIGQDRQNWIEAEAELSKS